MHISLCDNKVRSLKVNNFFDCIVQCTPKKWTTFEEGISNLHEAAKLRLLLCIPKELIPQVSQLGEGKTVIPLCVQAVLKNGSDQSDVHRGIDSVSSVTIN